jgi:hypothetical protein
MQAQPQTGQPQEAPDRKTPHIRKQGQGNEDPRKKRRRDEGMVTAERLSDDTLLVFLLVFEIVQAGAFASL